MSHLLNSTKFPLTAPSMGLMRSRKKRLKKLFAKSVAFYRSPCRCLGSCGFAAMQGAAPVALIRRPLARRTFTSLGAAPLAGPNRHGIPFSRLVFVMLKSPPVMGYYYTPIWAVWLGGRVLVHGPRPKQNHPAPTELRQHDSQDLGGCVLYCPIVHWIMVPGPRA